MREVRADKLKEEMHIELDGAIHEVVRTRSWKSPFSSLRTEHVTTSLQGVEVGPPIERIWLPKKVVQVLEDDDKADDG